MHARKPTWKDGAAATAREDDAGAGSSARLLCSTRSKTSSEKYTRYTVVR